MAGFEAGFVEFIRTYQVPIFLLIGFVILLTIFYEKWASGVDFPTHTFGDYEKTTLKEMFDESTRRVVSKRGKKVNSKFFEGKFEQGYIYKEISRTEADEPIEISVKRSSNDEKTEETKEVRIQLIGNDSSKMSRYKDKFSNSLRSAVGKTDGRDIQIVSEDLIKSETEDKVIFENGIDWNFDPDIECWIALGTAENNVKKRTVMDKTLNKMLEEFPNYVDKANNVNPNFTMNREIEEAKKKDRDDPGV